MRSPYIVVPAVLLHFLDLSGSIKNARGVDGNIQAIGEGADKEGEGGDHTLDAPAGDGI
jgi:hypothetical protein